MPQDFYGPIPHGLIISFTKTWPDVGGVSLSLDQRVPIWSSTEERLRFFMLSLLWEIPGQVVHQNFGIRNLCQNCRLRHGLPRTCISHFEGRRWTSDPTCVCALAACANRKRCRGNLGWKSRGFLRFLFRS